MATVEVISLQVIWPGVPLRIWLKQGKERILLARILEFLEKARKRLSRQNSTIKVRKCEEKRPEFTKKARKRLVATKFDKESAKM